MLSGYNYKHLLVRIFSVEGQDVGTYYTVIVRLVGIAVELEYVLAQILVKMIVL